MFQNAFLFDANLSSRDVSNVYDFSYMFLNASSFQGQGIDKWDTSNGITMSLMFQDAVLFDANMSSWNVARVIDFSYLFAGEIKWANQLTYHHEATVSSNDRQQQPQGSFDLRQPSHST
jgi:Mycoplasma protein of unknown function, DUF285